MPMGLLAISIVTTVFAAEGDEPLPRTVDVRPGIRSDYRSIDCGDQKESFYGGDLTFRKPGAVYARAEFWAGRREVDSWAYPCILAEVLKSYDVRPSAPWWTDVLGIGALAWETPSFGPHMYLRAGVLAVFSHDGLVDYVTSDQRLYDKIAIASPDQLTAGPLVALGGDFRLGELRMEPRLEMAHRFPVASSTTWRDEWLAADLAEHGLRLPLGFVSPVGSVGGRLGFARGGSSIEFGYTASRVGVSRYDAVMNSERRGPAAQVQPFTVESWELRFGGRFGKAQEGDSGSDEKPEGIQHIGVPELDALFKKVEAIRQERERLHRALEQARRSVEALASQLGAGSAADLVAGIRSGGVDLGVQITIDGGRPKVTPSATLEGEAAAAAKAIEDLSNAAQKVKQSVPALVKKAKELVAQAQETVKAGPSMLKDAGIPPKEIPNALKALKGNVQVTAALPAELQATLKEALGLVQMFTGGGDE
jgi:hypothetical protein